MENWKLEILENAYAEFVSTDEYGELSEKVEALNNKLLSSTLDRNGIGTKLLEDGSYDWESGQLLEDMKLSADELTEQEYDAICDIAIAYENYAKSKLEEVT